MIISLCGDEMDKKVLINELMNVYRDRVVLCDYFKYMFKALVDNEKIKYEMIDKYKDSDKVRKMYSECIDTIVITRINKLLEDNKDKIILIVSDNILTRDVDETKFFQKSDLKILITSEKSTDDYLNFDYIINKNDKDEIRKLVKEL